MQLLDHIGLVLLNILQPLRLLLVTDTDTLKTY